MKTETPINPILGITDLSLKNNWSIQYVAILLAHDVPVNLVAAATCYMHMEV